MDEDEELNPFLNITLSLFDEEYFIFDFRNYKFWEKNDQDKNIYKLRKKVNDFELGIYFSCGNDPNCSTFKGNEYFGRLDFIYPMYQINHFEDIPVQLIDNEENYIANSMLLYFPNAIGGEWMTFEWETVKYSDKKSMLDLLTNRQREYTFGNLKNKEPKIDFIFKEQYFIEDHGEKGYFLFMIYLQIKNYYEEYVYYERKKV